MSDKKTITEAQLNAFIDNELDDNEQVEVLNLINDNSELAQTVNEIRHDMDMVALAYRKIPVKGSMAEFFRKKDSTPWRYAAVAAGVFLFFGVISGWFVSGYTEHNIRDAFAMVDNYDPTVSKAEKILIHVSSLDTDRVKSALDKLEEILEVSQKAHNKVQLEFIANAEGLAVLRQGSPYAEKISLLSSKYNNVRFLACGIAMETAKLKEHKAVILLPEAKKIPAALNEILEKLEAGWLYMRS